MNICLIVFTTLYISIHVIGGEKEKKEDPYESIKKKSILDYTEADLEKLYDQWEEDEDPLPDDELPEYKRPPPKIDMSKFDPNNPEGMLKMSKKGQTLMMFATVSGDPTERETEDISQIWQSGLFNANIEIQRYVVGKDRVLFMLKDGSTVWDIKDFLYVVGKDRVLFMLKDGSTAWDIKDFLTQQDRCDTITIEGKDYYGKGSSKYKEEKADKKGKKKKKTEDSKKSNKNSENDINKKAKTEL